MSAPVVLLLVFTGGAVGAPLRYVLDRAVQARRDSVYPWGTFTVNLSGSLVLGLLGGLGSHVPEPVGVWLGVGLCGALTTYSTFGYETVRLLEGGARWYAVVNVLATVFAGLAIAAAGYAVGAAL